MDGFGEFDLPARKIAVGIFAQLLAEDKDGVQGRTQLVGHVGEEFRLVFRCERKLCGFFLQRSPRLLDFLVLCLDFDVPFLALLGLLFQLFVGHAAIPLLCLKFGCELLRLLEQSFRLHRCFNRVEHDADGHCRVGPERKAAIP